MSQAKKHAAVWLAFSSGMYAEAVVHAAKFADEQIDADDARTMFRVACGEALDALGIAHDEIAPIFDKGMSFMAELRTKGVSSLTKPEDSPPNEYPGPERQLAGKPDGRLS